MTHRSERGSRMSKELCVIVFSRKASVRRERVPGRREQTGSLSPGYSLRVACLRLMLEGMKVA